MSVIVPVEESDELVSVRGEIAAWTRKAWKSAGFSVLFLYLLSLNSFNGDAVVKLGKIFASMAFLFLAVYEWRTVARLRRRLRELQSRSS